MTTIATVATATASSRAATPIAVVGLVSQSRAIAAVSAQPLGGAGGGCWWGR